MLYKKTHKRSWIILLFFFVSCYVLKAQNCLNPSSEIRDFFIKANVFLDKTEHLDSAYYYYNKALLGYKQTNDSVNVSKVYLNLSKTNYFLGDMKQSSDYCIEALNWLPPTKYIEQLTAAYTLLGVINKELKNYQKAISYHTQSLTLRKELNIPRLEIVSLNNIGVVYKDMKEYKKAILYFNKALTVEDVEKKHPLKYARIVNNIAYCNIQTKDYNDLPEKLFKALEIQKKKNSISGQLLSYKNLALYFHSKNRNEKATYCAKKALDISLLRKQPEDRLELLNLLSKTDPKKEIVYLREYISLNDSIQVAKKNKLTSVALIKFETSEKEKTILELKNKTILNDLRLAKQERNTTYLIALIIGLMVVLILGYFVYKIRQKNLQHRLQIEKLQAKEAERNKLSGNVHDAFASLLYDSMNTLDKINKGLQNTEIEKVTTILDNAYERARDISQEYKQLDFSNVPFEKSLSGMITDKKMQYDFGIITKGIHNIGWATISNNIKTEVYRIIQEALLNAYKHADASVVEISFNQKKHFLFLTVSDNGKGVNASTINESVGLSGIRSRIKDLGGKVQVKNEKGFSINCKIPI